MTRDGTRTSFEEYAAARAAWLHRTAYLLTGQRADADDLVQVTLVKLYLGWDKVARAGSPDAYARRVMVNAFVSGRRPARFTREQLVSTSPPVAGSERSLRLAWGAADGTVHLPSGRTVQVDGLSGIVSRDGTTMVATGAVGEETWWLVREDTSAAGPRLEELVVGATGTPVVAVGGGHVAFMRTSPRVLGFQLVSRDVDRGTSQTTDVDQGSGARSVLGVTGVDDAGRVLVERRSAAPQLWDPSGGVVTVTGLPDGSSVTLLPGGSAQAYSSDRLTSQRVTLPSDGTAVLVGEGRAGYATLFNHDATAYVEVADPTSSSSAVSLVSVAPDATTSSQGPLSLPEGRWSPLGWESAAEVVLSARVSGSTVLVRCSVLGAEQLLRARANEGCGAADHLVKVCGFRAALVCGRSRG